MSKAVENIVSEEKFHGKATVGDKLKFMIVSAIGVFLFMVPLPDDGSINIPLGFMISGLESFFQINEQVNLATWLLLAFCVVSVVGSVVTLLFKPTVIMNNKTLKQVFDTSSLYVVSRLVGLAFAFMIFFEVGPEAIISGFTGGVMLGIASHLVSVFLILGFAMALLTDFGLMEFMGILISKVTRALFTLPGRASIDMVSSWLGSSTAAVILTRGQHEKGHYTGREAAAIAVNFSLVSLPFSFVIASTIGIESYFLPWYLIICVTCFVLAGIMPRIWPLKGVSDKYVDGKEKESDEVIVPEGVSTFSWAVEQSAQKASITTAKDVVASGLSTYANIFFDLIPLVIAWGTMGLILVEFTPIFNVISAPLGWFLQIFQIPGAMELAPAALIGFIDMFLPAFLLGAAGEGYVISQLILGALSIVQIIYVTETGILIAKSKIPLNLGKLFLIFMIRTILAVPIITLLVHLFLV